MFFLIPDSKRRIIYLSCGVTMTAWQIPIWSCEISWERPGIKVSGRLQKWCMKIKCSQVCKCLYIALSLSETGCSEVRTSWKGFYLFCQSNWICTQNVIYSCYLFILCLCCWCRNTAKMFSRVLLFRCQSLWYIYQLLTVLFRGVRKSLKSEH